MRETVYRIPAPVSLTIALVADFHNTDPEPVIQSLHRNRPDMIAIVGDFLVGFRPETDILIVESQENVLPFLITCASIAPTYVSLGNHEWMISDEDIDKIQETGAVVVDNGWVRLEVVEPGVLIGGLTSAIISNYRDFRERSGERYPYRSRHSHPAFLMPDVSWLSDFERQEGYKILLCHHPEYWSLREPYLVNHSFDLVLSGHAHGGQVCFFGHGLYAPGQGMLPKYTSGVYDGRLVVSRGLANTAHPVPRVFNPTEVVYIRLGG